MKQCNKCNQEKEEIAFGGYKDKRTGVQRTRNRCKACRSADESKKYHDIPEIKQKHKSNSRRISLKNTYNITEEDFDIMFEAQKGKCAICKQVPERKLNIDHCHSTGKVRGLLCWNCNIALGYLKDDINRLENAIKYLK